MLIENTLFGERNKIRIAIERLKSFEPKDGYYLAFSGGKDSIVIHQLAIEAEVRFTAYYNLTTVDPPELIYFIREKFPHVQINYPKKTMWQLIVQHKIPPSRLIRYCCAELKEHYGTGRTIVTGVRWSESVKRKQNRAMLELNSYTKKVIMLNNDNDESRKLLETCIMKSKHSLNPIIDWTTNDVWEFIRLRKLEYCFLYDKGFTRLGCIGCPMAGGKGMKWEFAQYPKYYQAYLRAFDKMLIHRQETGLQQNWNNAQHVMDWWLGDVKMKSSNDMQISIDDFFN